jgi:hypothetical protein
MKTVIEEALAPLVGLPLWAGGRSLDLEWFQFGGRHKVKVFRGVEEEVGEFAVHTQCAWRIAGPQAIIVASRDRLKPRGNLGDVSDEFDPNEPGATLCDERMDALFAQPGADSLVVERIIVGEWGDFSLRLRGGFTLDVFPDDSLAEEHWRVFRPYNDSRHFVLKGSGIEK